MSEFEGKNIHIFYGGIMMKNAMLAPISVLTAFCLVACSAKTAEIENVSQLRYDLLTYEADKFTVVCYPEIREKNFLSDGIAGEKDLLLGFRFYPTNTVAECVSVSLEADGGTYTAEFDEKSGSDYKICEMQIPTFNKSDLKCMLSVDGELYSVCLSSVKNADTITYTRAVNGIIETDAERLSAFKKNEPYETRIRLIENNGYNFWYVGFINPAKTLSYLVDGATGEILAVKEN